MPRDGDNMIRRRHLNHSHDFEEWQPESHVKLQNSVCYSFAQSVCANVSTWSLLYCYVHFH